MKNTQSGDTLVSRLRTLYGQYGYTQYRMRKFEEYDLYVRNKSFLTSDHIITFTEPNGKLMALRPDVTLSIVKNTKASGGVQKVYYKENVYRVDADAAAFREITQVGLECVGEIDAYCKLEVLLLAEKSLCEISEEYVLDVSHLGILSAVLDDMGAPDELRAPLLHAVGEKNLHGARALCRAAGIPDERCTALLTLVSAYGAPGEVFPKLNALSLGEGGRAALAEFSAILAAIEEPANAGRIRVDFSVVNDMNYYNGIVFRGFVAGVPSGVLSGGQYDYLVEKMGKGGGAIGFAVYPDLLEKLMPPSDARDVDVLLLYEADADLGALRAAVATLTEGGKRVAVRTAVPDKMTYARLLRLGENGVEILEEHA